MANIKYNFKKEMTDAADKPIIEAGKTVMINEALSNVLMNSTINERGIVLKYFGWGIDLQKTGVLMLDDADKESLENYILTTQALPILGKGRMIEILKNPIK